jgi:hypothetical protein
MSPLAKSALLKATGAAEIPKENGVSSAVAHLESRINGA